MGSGRPKNRSYRGLSPAWLGASALLLAVALATPASAGPGPWRGCKPRALPGGTPAELGVDPTLAADLSALLRDAVATKRTASAALVVLRRGKVLFRGGAGGAAPQSIFDLASVTKAAATAPAVMWLKEQGKLRLQDPASKHTSLLAAADKKTITVEQLLLHTSGLPSVVWSGNKPHHGRKLVLSRVRKARLKAAPGERFGYSDTGYIVLGELVRAASGQRLDALTHARIYRPLGMCNTGFTPPASRLSRVMAAWPEPGKKGKPYDPLATRLGGVAGHAGLFSSADDLARFGQMMLNGGALQGVRVLSAASVADMARPRTITGRDRPRGLGWDFAHKPLGRLSSKAHGHGGFTGTSLWIDPARQLVVVLLTNRTRLRPARSVSGLRRRIHDAVLGALSEPPTRPVLTGLDHLVAKRFAPLRGRRVALITNRAAVDRKGRWIVDHFLSAPKVHLEALLVPEHGLSAKQDRRIRDTLLKRGKRRIPVRSLFGHRRRPDSESLAGVDTLVFDVPAVGVRYYTYITTMGRAMEVAARRKLRFVVLDRPDPLGGDRVQGPLSSVARRSFTNYHPLPVRYGMTMGELARHFVRVRKIKVKLQVIRLSGWRRGQLFPRQGLPWRNPSPNIRSWRQALLYGGVGMVEGTNVAVGRGTDSPFQIVGAPWIRGRDLARRLNRHKVPGVYWVATRFTPSSSRHRNKLCQGARVVLLDPGRLDPALLGVSIAAALRRLYPRDWKHGNLYKLLSHPATTRAVLAGKKVLTMPLLWKDDLARFATARRRSLLY